MRAIILAAGRGLRLQQSQEGQLPKCLLPFGGMSLLERHLRLLRRAGVEDIVLALGFRHELVEAELDRLRWQPRPQIVLNSRFELGSMLTVHTVADALTRGGDVLLMDADVLYHERIMTALVGGRQPVNRLLIDRDFEGGDEPVKVCLHQGMAVEFRKQLAPGLQYDTIGESVGFFRFHEAGARRLATLVAGYVDSGRAHLPHEEAVRDMLLERSYPFETTDVTGAPWIEIDFPIDVDRAAHDVLPQLQSGSGRTGLARSAKLRRMLHSDRLEFLMEAHNGLSARIVREAGFQGIWASGLSISAQFGVRDNNEASWTQIVDMLEFMADASDLPILLDGDTGYGNFNNVRRLVRKLEQRGIAGVCIEDKRFPKTNSFLNGERQPLADIAEFTGKIAAGKDTQNDPNFSIIARVEALIAGWGMDEALRRAESYRRAGADAILIHSKLSRPDEILTFAREWAGRAPLAIVPTRYYSTPTDVFRKAGISMVIWANHMVRSAASAMQSVAREIHQGETLVNVEDRIAPVSEIFRLQDADEYSAAERIYLSVSGTARSAIVLAASRGEGLEAVTLDRPKVMLPIAGKPLLRWLVDGFKKENINDITVVGGYRADAIDTAGIRLVVNERHARTGELASLACGMDSIESDLVISYGDLLFRSYVLRDLVECDADFSVVVDSSPTSVHNRTVRDFAYCSSSDDRGLFGTPVLLERVASGTGDSAQGRWIGLLNVRRHGLLRLRGVLSKLRARPDFDALDMPALLNALIADGAAIAVLYVHGHWRSVNDLEEFRSAVDFAHGHNPEISSDD